MRLVRDAADIDPLRLSLPSGTASAASGLSMPAANRFAPQQWGLPSRVRRPWAMNIAAIPLRQWLVALSGLACGMMAALIVHYPEAGCNRLFPHIRGAQSPAA